MQPAVSIERDVARVVPAVLDHLGREVGPIEIPLHHVRPLDPQQPFLADGQVSARLGVDDLGLHVRDGPADGPFFAAKLAGARGPVLGDVEGDDRRQFRRAVAFARPDAELFLEGIAQIDRQLLGTGEHDFERGKILRLAAPQIVPQERRGRHQNRHPVLPAHLAHLPSFERAEMIHALGIERERGPEDRGESGRMEKRQDAGHHVIGPKLQQVVDALDVRGHVALREHHALRLAGRAGREDHGQQIVVLDLVDAEQSAPICRADSCRP